MADCRTVVDPADAASLHRRGLAAIAVALLTVGFGCSSGDDDAGSGATDGAPVDRSVVEPATPDPPYAVGLRTLTLVDDTRGTDAVPNLSPAAPDRTVEVDVLYPAEGEPAPEPAIPDRLGGAAVADAPPVGVDLPLVVFAHGWSGLGRNFRGLAEAWAREGYVVALPTFPLSRQGLGVSADARNQPADVTFVIDELAAVDDDDPLAGRLDLGRVAVGGHSLGGATALGVAFNSCCLDDRVDAVIEVAGGPLPFEGGTYDTTSDTPMLVAHGAADTTVPVAVSDAAVFDLFAGPTWYLRLDRATHNGVFEGEAGALFEDASLAFLDAELRDDAADLDEMGATVAASGLGEWRAKPPPSPPG